MKSSNLLRNVDDSNLNKLVNSFFFQSPRQTAYFFVIVIFIKKLYIKKIFILLRQDRYIIES